MIKNLIKFCYKLRSRKNYLYQNNFIRTTSTYKNNMWIFKKYFRLNYEKKLTTFTEKLEKVKFP